mgnify:CR=1 FL=1
MGKDHSGTTGVTFQPAHTAPASNQFWHVGNGTGLYSLTYGASLFDDTWHHLAMTKSNTLGMAIYLDGALVTSQASLTSAISWGTGDWYFGRGTQSDRIAKGLGALLRIYTRALSTAELLRHFTRERRWLGV